ncbi:MAG: hypothetical protein MH321_08350 [Leptospiraceae bacterium]|nr:hypothetical protein [Leptospiraceae bacterium]
MSSKLTILSGFLGIWFGLIFISPLFGIHLHHSLLSNNTEVAVIHSYYESDHASTSQAEESEAQTLFEHISPYGITSDLGDWDGDLVYDIALLILVFLSCIAYSIFKLDRIEILVSKERYSKILFFSRKSYLNFCLLNHLPPPSTYII